MPEEYISLQPFYDSKDFKEGDLVTCMRITSLTKGTRDLLSSYEKNRQVDFYGLVTKTVMDGKNWFMVEQMQSDGSFEKGIFHRSELGMGYQPSWHPMVAADAIEKWLKNENN